MKPKIIIIFLILGIFSSFSIAILAQDHEHGMKSEDQCVTPTEFVVLMAVEDGADLSFNVSSLSYPTGTCVQLTFVNPTATPHDFTIDHVMDVEFDMVHVGLDNNTD